MANNYKVGTEITVDAKKANESVNDLASSFEHMIDGLEETSTALENVESASKETAEAIDDAAKKTDDAAKKTNDWKKNLESLGKGLKDFGKNMSLYVTAPITAFAAVAVNEFMNAEKELTQLNIALNNSGNYSKAAVTQFQALATELEKTTNFSGGAVTTASALALGFTKTTEEAERLVRAAADLSSATGMDLDSSVQALGQSLQGVSGSLARTLPQMRNLTEEQLKAGEALRYVEERFKGSALQATQNLGGEITRLKNGFSAFAGEIGEQLAPYIRGLVSLLNQALDYVRNLDPVVRNTAIGVALFAAAIGPVAVAVGGFVALIPTLVTGLGAIATGIGAVLGVIFGPVGLLVALAGSAKLFYDLWQISGSAGKALFLTWQWVGAQFYNIFVIPLVSGLETVLSVMSRIPGAIGRGFETAADFVRSIKDGLKANTASMTAEVDKVFEGTGKSAADSFTFGLSTALGNLKDKVADSFTLPVQQGFQQVNSAQEEFVKKSKKESEKTNQYAQSISGSFANAFSTIADGTKSVGDAFSDMATSIVQDLTRMILQQSIYNAIAGFFGPTGGTPATAATGGFVQDGQITRRFASGGMVRGPGTGTSDSIPARLSNGEFVSDARTVSFFGPDFFTNLKRMAGSFNRPSPMIGGIPRFANGGMVSGGGSGETRIVIQNSGSPKEASSVTTEQDAQGMVVNIILEDIQRNGNIAKTFQTNYGLKRGGV